MGFLERATGSPPARTTFNGVEVTRRTERVIDGIGQQVAVRTAQVQATTVVATIKMREVDRMGRDAMTGQAMLHKWAATLHQGDPFLAEDLRLFQDVAKMGKAQIISDTIDWFRMESMRY